MTLRAILKLIFLAGLANFAVFWVAAGLIGGDAINGGVDEGRYYLANHGRLTEVSEVVFHYSLAHTISVFVTHPLAIAAAGAIQFMNWHKQRLLDREIDEMLDGMRQKGRAG